MKTIKRLCILFFIIINASVFGQSPEYPQDQTKYIIFPGHVSAISYYANMEQKYYSLLGVEKARKVIGVKDTRYKYLKEIVSQLMEGFQDLYPEYTENLSDPFPILVEDESPNAFVTPDLSDMNAKKIPYIIVIHTGLMDFENDRDALFGVLAHELTHLFFQHTINSNPQYSIEGKSNFNSNNLKNDIEDWKYMADTVGELTWDEFNGIPLMEGSEGYSYLRTIVKNSRSERCGTVEDFDKQINSALNYNGQSLMKYKYDIGVFSKKLDIFLSECSKSYNPTLLELASDANGIPSSELLKLIESSGPKEKQRIEKEINLFDGRGSAYSGLKSITNTYFNDMKAIESTYELRKVRYYSNEDHADEISIKILDHLGMNPAGVGLFLLHALPPEDQEKCLDTIKRGESPNYGSLRDDHHSNCWRYQRALNAN